MNIIVSGWPGVGQTSLSILLAYNLNYKLVQGSNTFRYIWAKLNNTNTGISRVKAEVLQKSWGHLFEEYVARLVVEDSKIVLESDITGLMIKNPTEVFSIFLIADEAVRKARLKNDGRADDVDVLEQRDETLNKAYHDEFGVNFLDLDDIKKYYTLVMDNTSKDFKTELEEVYEILIEKDKSQNVEFLSKLVIDAQDQGDLYKEKGKKYFLDLLQERKLIATAEELLQNVQKKFPNEVAALPQEIREIVMQA